MEQAYSSDEEQLLPRDEDGDLQQLIAQFGAEDAEVRALQRQGAMNRLDHDQGHLQRLGNRVVNAFETKKKEHKHKKTGEKLRKQVDKRGGETKEEKRGHREDVGRRILEETGNPDAAYGWMKKKEQPTSRLAQQYDEVRSLPPIAAPSRREDRTDATETVIGPAEITEGVHLEGGTQALEATEGFGLFASGASALHHGANALRLHGRHSDDPGRDELLQKEKREEEKEALLHGAKAGAQTLSVVRRGAELTHHMTVADNVLPFVGPVTGTMNAVEALDQGRQAVQQDRNRRTLRHGADVATVSELPPLGQALDNLAHLESSNRNRHIVDAVEGGASAITSFANTVPTVPGTIAKGTTTLVQGATQLEHALHDEMRREHFEHAERKAQQGGPGATEAKEDIVRHNPNFALDALLHSRESQNEQERLLARQTIENLEPEAARASPGTARALLAHTLQVPGEKSLKTRLKEKAKGVGSFFKKHVPFKKKSGYEPEKDEDEDSSSE